MIITETFTKRELRNFLKSKNIKNLDNMTIEEMNNISQKIIKKELESFKKNYKGGNRVIQCIEPNGKVELGKTVKGLCSNTGLINRPKSGCTFGAKPGMRCVPCKTAPNGTLPKKCRGCPAGENVFYCD